ncbi:MAG: DUF1800 family protein [Alphaproteobacteria bacterium]|nr:DUF1800 family protein [Alphaproteobacteria bacterium]MBV8406708.1 DUF1800 family protein [Alphaproteobacteria bacterium]
MTNSLEAALALSRFGLGARDGSLTAIAADPRGALRQEITSRSLAMPTGAELRPSPALLIDLFAFLKARRLERERKAPVAQTANGLGAAMASSAVGAPPTNNAMDNRPQQVFLAEVDARFNGTMRDPVIGFPERLAIFWANHFAVAISKGPEVRMTAGAFEREAIRPHLFGRFEDMLLAVETHAAMLAFLDNQQSIGPDSRAGVRAKRGLNENLAREIMELHTLGVDGGYSQRDVTSLARIITGWTIEREQRGPHGVPLGPPGTFVFNANAHEPGPQSVLGVSYRDDGVEQGRAALRDLARHPSTARHIAVKLVRHFVADAPPPSLVSRVADAFARTRGDLSAVYVALIGADEAWNPELGKVRSPIEYLVAMLRASGARPKPQAIMGMLNALGQPFWNPSGPNGFPDTVDAWASSEGLAMRIDAANLIAQSTPGTDDPRGFARSLLGPLLSSHTEHAMARAEDRKQALALAYLSPEFQRR